MRKSLRTAIFTSLCAATAIGAPPSETLAGPMGVAPPSAVSLTAPTVDVRYCHCGYRHHWGFYRPHFYRRYVLYRPYYRWGYYRPHYRRWAFYRPYSWGFYRPYYRRWGFYRPIYRWGYYRPYYRRWGFYRPYYRWGYYRPYYRRYWGYRYPYYGYYGYNPGAAIVGSALGLVGAGLAAATAPAWGWGWGPGWGWGGWW
ncbi:MAG TPA: hypothetical protein VIF34_16530 [Methylocystis sp.]|jgi:hypothetical protein